MSTHFPQLSDTRPANNLEPCTTRPTILEIYKKDKTCAIRIFMPKDAPDVSILLHSYNNKDRDTGMHLINLEGDAIKGKDVLLKTDSDNNLPETMPNFASDTVIFEIPSLGVLFKRGYKKFYIYEKPAVDGEYEVLIDSWTFDESKIHEDIFLVRIGCSSSELMCKSTIGGRYEYTKYAFPNRYMVRLSQKEQEEAQLLDRWIACDWKKGGDIDENGFPIGTPKSARFVGDKMIFDTPLKFVGVNSNPCKLESFPRPSEAESHCKKIGCTGIYSIDIEEEDMWDKNDGYIKRHAPLIFYIPTTDRKEHDYRVSRHMFDRKDFKFVDNGDIRYTNCYACLNDDHMALLAAVQGTNMVSTRCCSCGGGEREAGHSDDFVAVHPRHFDQEKRHTITFQDVALRKREQQSFGPGMHDINIRPGTIATRSPLSAVDNSTWTSALIATSVVAIVVVSVIAIRFFRRRRRVVHAMYD